MKIKKIIISLFCLVLLTTLVSCDFGTKCNHQYSDFVVTKEATCDENGSKKRICSLCNEKETVVIEALGHQYSEYIITCDATCLDEGTKERECAVCHQKEFVTIDATGHKFVEYHVTKEPTCEETGLEEHECNICHTKESKVLPVTDHTYSTPYITVNATCTSTGISEIECSVCHHKEQTIIPILSHVYQDTIINPTCTTDGYTLSKCSLCNNEVKKDYVNKLGHDFNAWHIINASTEDTEGLEQRECSRCDEVETKAIPKIDYIDMDIIKFDYHPETIYSIKNYDELSLLFNASVLSLSPKTKCVLEYEHGDFNALLNNLSKDTRIPFHFQINASLKGKELELTFTYGEEATNKTDGEDRYTQYNSLNYKTTTKTRSNDFDDFKINYVTNSYNVVTSEQLFYTLERGVKPICKEGSIAEVVYNSAKDVLRNIINDNMTDFEKTRAIYEWLIMNVCYDGALLDLLYSNTPNISTYQGFYLEGVFINHRAVCEGISKAFTVLANIEGIQCVQITGYQTKNPNGANHAWNKIKIDGNWYVIDATSGGVIMNNVGEMLSYETFLISEDKMREKYTADNFVDIICDKEYAFFENESFANLLVNYNMVITSQLEFNAALTYFKNYDKENKTFQVKISLDYGDSIVDELQTAMTAAIYNGSISYSFNNNLFTFMEIK